MPDSPCSLLEGDRFTKGDQQRFGGLLGAASPGAIVPDAAFGMDVPCLAAASCREALGGAGKRQRLGRLTGLASSLPDEVHVGAVLAGERGRDALGGGVQSEAEAALGATKGRYLLARTTVLPAESRGVGRLNGLKVVGGRMAGLEAEGVDDVAADLACVQG